MIKDWYITRTQLILSFCIFLLPNIMLIAYALNYNPAGDESGGLFPTLVGAFTSVVSILGCSSFMINTVNEDVTSGWIRYALTTSASERKICLAKMLNCVILTFGLAGISLLFNLFAAARCGNTEVMAAAPICTAFLQLSALCPVFPLAIRFGARKASMFYIGFLLIVVGVIFIAACLISGTPYHKIPTELRVVFYGVIPLLAIISAGLSLGLGKNLSRRI